MKKLNGFLMFISLSFIIGMFSVNSCTHEDDPLAPIIGSTFEYGNDAVAIADGYNFDKTHSSVRWETAYLGTSALLTGRFNNFEFSIDFDQDSPENIFISGKVTLSSVNTGEPGRDAGCLLGTFGTDISDEASFESTEFKLDDEGGYTFTGDLNFHGIESSISGTMEYLGTTLFDENSGVHGAPLNVAGFVVRFEFNAKSAFGIESGNIADRIVVSASGQFKKSL